MFDQNNPYMIMPGGKVGPNLAYAGPGAAQVPMVAPSPAPSSGLGSYIADGINAAGNLGQSYFKSGVNAIAPGTYPEQTQTFAQVDQD